MGHDMSDHGGLRDHDDHGKLGDHDNLDHKSGHHHMTTDQQLAKNSKLAGKIEHLTGMPAQQACSGFKNLGQCVAAAHVSKNLGISFACMKSDMTGTAPAAGSVCPAGTGSKSMSLGKAIQTLDPGADNKLEAKKGEKEADQDLKEPDKADKDVDGSKPSKNS